MVRTAGRVLKSEDCKLEGKFHLDITQVGLGLPKQTVTATSAPKVRMLENKPEYAVIEVTCSCGTTISIRCEYANEPASAPSDNQT
jgi:hypothetical protein